MGSASSVGFGPSGDEDQGGNGFVNVHADDTEVETMRRKRPHSAASEQLTPDAEGLNARGDSPRPMPSRLPKRSASDGNANHPLPARVTLLPHTLTVAGKSITLNRKRCEDVLLLGAVVFGIVQLSYGWNEWAVSGEITTLLVLSIAYVYFRVRPAPTPSSPGNRPRTPLPPLAPNGVRASGARRSSHAQPAASAATVAAGARAPTPVLEDDVPTTIGRNGCIWGTEEREYRECLDDGALFALLLCPVVAAGLLHAALLRLSAEPDKAVLPGWVVEEPLVIATTPIRRISATVPRGSSDVTRALSALAISRRNLVQLFTLLSFVLLVQLTWSLRQEVVRARSSVANGTPTAASAAADKTATDTSDASGKPAAAPHPVLPGTYWLRRGELRRNLSVIGFAFLVTSCCVVVKIVTARIDYGVWSDMSHSDIILATLFYQFCLYVCVRLARRGFTLGELAVVTNAGTAMFMETVNMTRMKIPIIQTPYIKTYRLPTPLLTYQLALIPGSLLTGFLLSPLLYLSRHLAQRPARRLRFPHEKPVHRRLLALGFYAGSFIVVFGVVGTWARWELGWRDPWLYVFWFLVEGQHPWTRPALIAYWGVLAMFAVGAWQRQLSRARRHRLYTVPGSSRDSSSSVASAHQPTVASQMMDAANQRIPTLSVNARRKSFHALAVAMFIPGISIDPAFTHLAFSVAFAAFTFAEYIRYFALWPLGVSVHLFLNEFIDHKDSGTAILSHFYLLAGSASPLWLEGPSQILAHFGVLSLGIGDAVASIVGRRMGYARWSPASGKTVEGSIGFVASVTLASILMWIVGAVESFNFIPFVITTTLVTLLEAFSGQNDNLVLPVYGWAVGTLLGV
ncbi:dolichol kinase [Vanrija albida]|uniref:dolichol kinase n=1 Tax=Vanrija albida TaxID=181172 RepID=A0ABR3Q8F7_9TREE